MNDTRLGVEMRGVPFHASAAAPHVGKELGGEARMRQHLPYLWRAQMERRGAVALQRVDHRVDGEALHQDERATGGQRRQRPDHQPGHPEERQRRQQGVVRGEPGALRRRQHRGQDGAVTEHHTFRPPGGAGGVQDACDRCGGSPCVCLDTIVAHKPRRAAAAGRRAVTQDDDLAQRWQRRQS